MSEEPRQAARLDAHSTPHHCDRKVVSASFDEMLLNSTMSICCGYVLFI
jgi:hypothetical protein